MKSVKMEFNPNKTPAETIREGVFGGTYLRDISSDVNGKWNKRSWKEFNQLKNIDQKGSYIRFLQHRIE